VCKFVRFAENFVLLIYAIARKGCGGMRQMKCNVWPINAAKLARTAAMLVAGRRQLDSPPVEFMLVAGVAGGN
jgi:hypothetical protein